MFIVNKFKKNCIGIDAIYQLVVIGNTYIYTRCCLFNPVLFLQSCAFNLAGNRNIKRNSVHGVKIGYMNRIFAGIYYNELRENKFSPELELIGYIVYIFS